MKIGCLHKGEKTSSFWSGIIKRQEKRNIGQSFIVQGKWHTSLVYVFKSFEKYAQMNLTIPKRKMKKVGEASKKIIQEIFFSFNYVLYMFRRNEGGFVSSPPFRFVAWNAYWSR